MHHLIRIVDISCKSLSRISSKQLPFANRAISFPGYLENLPAAQENPDIISYFPRMMDI